MQELKAIMNNKYTGANPRNSVCGKAPAARNGAPQREKKPENGTTTPK